MKIALLQHQGDPAYIEKLHRLGNYQVTDAEHADLILGVAQQGHIQTTPTIHEVEFSYRLFARHGSRMPIFVGVTGTNGKTTVTKLLASLLDCPAAGNIIGNELLHFVPENESQVDELPKYLVVELASAQCCSIRDFHPYLSIITNIRDDHFEFHGGSEEYVRAKAKIFANQDKDDFLIFNAKDEQTKTLLPQCRARTIAFDIDSSHPYDMAKIKRHTKLPGQFNLENALACVIAARQLGLDEKTIYERLSRFEGVENRMELIGDIEGTPVYNNTVATNPDATICALAALPGKGTLIMGGIYKEYLPIANLLSSIQRHCSSVILYGRSAEFFRQKLANTGYSSVTLERDFQSAIEAGARNSHASEYLLFSPTCLAYDVFKDTSELSKQFRKNVEQWLR